MEYQLNNFFKTSPMEADNHSTPTYHLRWALYLVVLVSFGPYQLVYEWRGYVFQDGVPGNMECQLDSFFKTSLVNTNNHSTPKYH